MGRFRLETQRNPQQPLDISDLCEMIGQRIHLAATVPDRESLGNLLVEAQRAGAEIKQLVQNATTLVPQPTRFKLGTTEIIRDTRIPDPTSPSRSYKFDPRQNVGVSRAQALPAKTAAASSKETAFTVEEIVAPPHFKECTYWQDPDRAVITYQAGEGMEIDLNELTLEARRKDCFLRADGGNRLILRKDPKAPAADLRKGTDAISREITGRFVQRQLIRNGKANISYWKLAEPDAQKPPNKDDQTPLNEPQITAPIDEDALANLSAYRKSLEGKNQREKAAKRDAEKAAKAKVEEQRRKSEEAAQKRAKEQAAITQIKAVIDKLETDAYGDIVCTTLGEAQADPRRSCEDARVVIIDCESNENARIALGQEKEIRREMEKRVPPGAHYGCKVLIQDKFLIITRMEGTTRRELEANGCTLPWNPDFAGEICRGTGKWLTENRSNQAGYYKAPFAYEEEIPLYIAKAPKAPSYY